MFVVILSFVLLVIALVAPFALADERGRRWPGYATSAGASVLLLLTLFLASLIQVPAGHVGIVYAWKDIVGQRDPGLQMIWPWQSIESADTRLQSLNAKLASFTKTNSQEIHIDTTFNFRVGKEQVQHLYRTVGPNYKEILILPRQEQIFKEVLIKYETLDVANKREEIRHLVSQRLVTELESYSIVAEDLFLRNITFDDKFQQAIEKVQIASQAALQAKFEAMKKIEEAEGEGQAILVKALKQAEANKSLAQSLSPILVQYETIQKLSPNVSVIMLGSGGGTNVIWPPELITGGVKQGDSRK